ncbi:hypothetical protein ACTG9Q_31930 [Actinokineospora sp. 24-640]
MSFSLSTRGFAPTALSNTGTNEVPRAAVVASSLFGLVAVLLNYLWPDTVFLFLLNAIGMVMLVIWGLVACAQLKLHRPEHPVRMWAHPYLSWVTLAAIVGLFVLLLTTPGGRTQVLSTAALVAVILIAFSVKRIRTR